MNIGYNALFAHINACQHVGIFFNRLFTNVSLVFVRLVVLSGLPTDERACYFYRIKTNDLNIRIVNNFCARHYKQSRFFLCD